MSTASQSNRAKTCQQDLIQNCQPSCEAGGAFNVYGRQMFLNVEASPNYPRMIFRAWSKVFHPPFSRHTVNISRSRDFASSTLQWPKSSFCRFSFQPRWIASLQKMIGGCGPFQRYCLHPLFSQALNLSLSVCATQLL